MPGSCWWRPAGEGAFGKDISVSFASSKLPRNLVSRFAAYMLAKLNHCPGDAFWMMRPKLFNFSPWS